MCGIIGVISRMDREDIGMLIGHGLYQLQNRGDFSAGIATIRRLPMSRAEYRRDRPIAVEHVVDDFNPLRIHKGNGKVSEVFTNDNLTRLSGFMGAGQVRYPTAGYTMSDGDGELPDEQKTLMAKASIQPLHAPHHHVVMVHNGDIHNYRELDDHFIRQGIRKAGHNDVEVLLKVFNEEFFNRSEQTPNNERIAQTIQAVFKRVKGTYSGIVLVNNVGIVAFRDPEGRRPLVYGVTTDDEGAIIDYAFASETVALDKMLFNGTADTCYPNGRVAYREIPPGGVVFVSKDFEFHEQQLVPPQPKPCPFEAAYFARAPSFINGRRVKHIRRELIEHMWRRFLETDACQRILRHKDETIIIAIPRTAESAAKHLSNITGIRMQDAVEKNPYSARIFQQPTQEHRVRQTIADHFIFEEDVKGKIGIIIDDSIVRGTTLMELVKYFRDLGMKDIHLFITFPPIRNPCMHAIDFHTSDELIAHNRSIAEIKNVLGLRTDETLLYATPDELKEAGCYTSMCDECYSSA